MFFVPWAKRNMDAQRRYSLPTDRSTGVICDQTVVLQGYQSAKDTLSICTLYKARC